MRIKPNDKSFDTFFELLTNYRLSTVLMTAVNSGLFDIIGAEGKAIENVIKETGWHRKSAERFLDCLVKLGFLGQYQDQVFPSIFTKQFLLSSSENSQLNSIQFEKKLFSNWQQLEEMLKIGKRESRNKSAEEYTESLKLFLSAMDEAAKTRAKELWDSFLPKDTGKIVEIGSGSGAYLAEFLEQNPGWKGVFCDLDDVVENAKENARLAKLQSRIQYISCNLLDEGFKLAEQLEEKADIVLYSNMLHCQSEQENAGILKRTLGCLKEDGFVIVHDFFSDVNWQGALYDLHMMLNTYNGQTYDTVEIAALLKANQLINTEMVQLVSKSAALFAAGKAEFLPDLGHENKLLRKAKELGFYQVKVIDPKGIPVHAWVQEKCRQGCDNYGKKPSCPPNSLSYKKMRELLQDYHKGILLVAEPPLRKVQENLLELEKTAFLGGFSKALAFTSGPCSLCDECTPDNCRFPSRCRSSLEACGVDVFTLASDNGIDLVPLKSQQDFTQYVCMLLVE